MDPSHGGGMGSYDPSQFGNQAWPPNEYLDVVNYPFPFADTNYPSNQESLVNQDLPYGSYAGQYVDTVGNFASYHDEAHLGSGLQGHGDGLSQGFPIPPDVWPAAASWQQQQAVEFHQPRFQHALQQVPHQQAPLNVPPPRVVYQQVPQQQVPQLQVPQQLAPRIAPPPQVVHQQQTSQQQASRNVPPPRVPAEQVHPQQASQQLRHQPVQRAADSAINPVGQSNQRTGLRTDIPDPFLRPVPSAKPSDSKPCTWEGAHNLEFIEPPIERAKVKNQQIIPVFLKSNKRRLFPERNLLIPAESLGRHLDACLELRNDDPDEHDKRRQLDYNLQYDLRRTEKDKKASDKSDKSDTFKIPEKWISRVKTEMKRNGLEYPDLGPASDELADLQRRASAVFQIPPVLNLNEDLVEQMAKHFRELVVEQIGYLRKNASYKAILEITKKDRTGGFDEEREKLRKAVEPLRQKLECVIRVALEKADDRVLARAGEMMPQTMTRLVQSTINCINTNDTNSPLPKAVLELLARFPSLRSEQLQQSKFFLAQSKLEEQGDDQIRAAIKRIISTVEKYEGPVSGNSKKPLADSRAASKTTTSKTMSSAGDNGRGKPSVGAPPPKRPREDSDDSRGITKRVATDGKVSTSQISTKASVAKASASSSQSSSSQPGTKTAISKTAASSSQGPPSSTQLQGNKIRPSSGLLPGKSRPPAKAAQKLEPAKADSPKSDLVKSSTTALASSASRSELTKPRLSQSASSASGEQSKSLKSKKPPAPKAEAPQQSKSTFAALMAEINEPKKVTQASTPTSSTAPDPDETPEERKRRLRKEHRRSLNLRVAFKNDDELVSIRHFTKEAAEDEGREGNMVIDAGDDRAEGKMLRQMVQQSKSGNLGKWVEPTLIDFRVIPEEQRRKNFMTRGGDKPFDTEQQKFMAEREKTELMVVYTDPADIPLTPKSPPPEPAQLATATSEAIEVPWPKGPRWDEFRQRTRDFIVEGRAGMLCQVKLRNDKRLNPGPVAPNKAMEIVMRVNALANSVSGPPTQRWDLYMSAENRERRDQRVLDLLRNGPAQRWVDPEPYNPEDPKTSRRHDYPDPRTQEAADAVENLVQQLKGKPAPPEQPPDWQQDPNKVDEWWHGFSQDKQRQEQQQREEAARQSAELAARLAQQQNPYAQYYQTWAGYPQVAQSTTLAAQQNFGTGATDALSLQATLPALASAAQQQPQAQSSTVPNSQDPNAAAFMRQLQLAQWAAMQQTQTAQGQAAPAIQSAQPQLYGGSTQSPSSSQSQSYSQGQGFIQEQSYSQGQSSNQNNQNQSSTQVQSYGQSQGGPSHSGRGGWKGPNASRIGTKMCTFYARGQCAKGDQCTFRHTK